VSKFGRRNFLGRHLAYIPVQSLPNIDLPHPAICAILVTEDEVEAIQEFGITRVMARLGQAAHYYPCPPWSDPSRPGISFAESRERSLLARVDHFHARGCRAYQFDDQIVLVLAKSTGALVAEGLAELPEEAAFALPTEFDRDADGCCGWEPGQSEPVAIAPEGSSMRRVCGCFLMFTVGQEKDGATRFEDGFGVFLKPQSWRELREAIRHEKPIRIPPTDGHMPLVLEWSSELFPNPVDGKIYVSPGGWRHYYPQSESSEWPAQTVTLDHTRLLTGEDNIAARTTTEDLAEFIREVVRRVDATFECSDKPFELMVQFKCQPTGHEIQMAHQGVGYKTSGSDHDKSLNANVVGKISVLQMALGRIFRAIFWF
jgi:hypothetical protein